MGHPSLTVLGKRAPCRAGGSALPSALRMSDPAPTWESTLSLLARARARDQSALDDLFACYAPPLRRWAGCRAGPATCRTHPTLCRRACFQQAVERSESALARLRPGDRELVIARVKLGLTYSEIAAAAAKPPPNPVLTCKTLSSCRGVGRRFALRA
jgi:hypothetical protein